MEVRGKDRLDVGGALEAQRKQRLQALVMRLRAELSEMEACQLTLAAALLDNAIVEVEREIEEGSPSET